MTSSGPTVCAVVSCGGKKQDLDPGESVPARELYTSSVHVCKNRYGRHSDGYYIMSAEYGLVRHDTEIAWYDRTLDDIPDLAVRAWGSSVARELRPVLWHGNYDAVVFIGGETYVGALEPHIDELPADVLTPWQTDDYVTGVVRGMAWCNDESNSPENVDSIRDIGTVVSRKGTFVRGGRP